MQFPYLSVQQQGNTFSVLGTREIRLGSPVKFSNGKGGIFANWKYDDLNKMLTAEVDPYGMYQLFYSEIPNGILISTSPIQLIALGANPALDYRALSVFCMFGWFIDQDTPFKAIKVFPPDGRLVWRDGTLKVSGQERLVPAISITREQAIVEYNRLFSSAIKSCWQVARGNVVIPLSGGRDSRHIVLESLRQGFKPHHCVTYSQLFNRGFDPEWECAKRVTSCLGLEHYSIKTLHSRFRDQISTIYLTHLGTDEHCQLLALRSHLAGYDSFDGIGMDVLTRNQNYNYAEKRQLIIDGKSTLTVDKMLADINVINQTDFGDRSNYSPECSSARKDARSHIANCMDRYRGTADPYMQFIFWTRCRREVSLAPSAMLNTANDVFCPGLDLGLVDFCASLPFNVTSDGKFHDAVISRYFPEVKVPYNDEMVADLPRPPVKAKLRSIIDCIGASSIWGLQQLAIEPFEQARMLIDRKYKKLHMWRSYWKTLKAIDGKRKAERFLASICS